jgi:hypothetical protein
MHASDIVAVFIRVFAIFLFMSFFRQMAWLVEYFVNGSLAGNNISPTFSAFAAVPELIGGLFCWKFPQVIARSIVGLEADADVTSVSLEAIVTAAVIGLGLYFLIQSISDLIYYLTLFNMEASPGAANFSLGANSIASAVATGFEIVIALLLVSRARQVMQLIMRVLR